MKRIVKNTLAVATAIAMCVTPLGNGIADKLGCAHIAKIANADQSGTTDEGLNYYFNSSDGSMTISGNGAMETFGSTPWSGLVNEVKSVKIDEGVKSLTWKSFTNATNLKTLEISSTVTRLGSYSFKNTGLVSVTPTGKAPEKGVFNIPGNIDLITQEVFSQNTGLEKLVFNEGTYQISTNAFDGCKNLKEIKFSSTIYTIGAEAFKDCTSLTTVTLPDGYKSTGLKVENGAFRGCSSLKEIKVSSANAYYYVSDGSLIRKSDDKLVQYPCGREGNNYYVPSGVKSIAEEAFADCNKLESIILPSTVTTIDNRAFISMENLKSIYIPKSVTSIGDYIFTSCKKLESIYYEGSKEEFDQIFDSGKQSLPSEANIEYNHVHASEAFADTATCEEDGYVLYCCYCGGNFSVGEASKAKGHQYDAGVVTKAATTKSTGIKTYTCTACGNKKTETIPKQAASQVSPADDDPSNPNPEIVTDKKITKGMSLKIAGSTYTITKVATTTSGTLTFAKSAKKAKITVPSTVKINGRTYLVTSIRANAFKNNKKLKKVTIGKNIKTIGKNAFRNCKKLKKIIIKSSKIKKIGRYAFKGINKKASFKLPKKKKKAYLKMIKK